MLHREDPWVVLEGRETVEAAIANWWDLVGVMAVDDGDWSPPEWSGLELLRRPASRVRALGDGGFESDVVGLAKQPEETSEVGSLMAEVDEDALLVVCPRLHSDRHVGSVIRNAAAMGQVAFFSVGKAAHPLLGRRFDLRRFCVSASYEGR